MKAKIKSGKELLFCEGISNNWSNLKDKMIINFNNKYTFDSFHQTHNHLEIFTSEGVIDIVFTGNVPVLEFNNYTKDQLVLKIN